MKIKSRHPPEKRTSHEKNRTSAHSLPRPRLVYALQQPDGEVVDSQRPFERQLQEPAQTPATLKPPSPKPVNSFLVTLHQILSNSLHYDYENYKKTVCLSAHRCHHGFLLPSASPVVAAQEKFQRFAHQEKAVLTPNAATDTNRNSAGVAIRVCGRWHRKMVHWRLARVRIFAAGTAGGRLVSKNSMF